MNLEEALKISLDYEKKVRDHYANGATTIEDPQGKKVFETLAKEEQGHVDYLEHCLQAWSDKGIVNAQEVTSILPTGSDWVKKAAESIQKREDRRVATSNEIDLLKIALELEHKASGFYKSVVEELPEEHKGLFDKFLEIEDGHVTIVQAELDSVQGAGLWFNVMEFNLEAG